MQRAHSPSVAIIGAGPSGLSAAYALCRAGIVPLIFERSDGVGGLMRSHRRGDFVVDIGRKELYSRIPVVSELWRALLGDDFRPYPHRVGSLYGGRILELSAAYRGLLRGVPITSLLAGGMSLAKGRATGCLRPPRTYEEYWHFRTGAQFAGVFAQGYWEKFRGTPWREMPPPEAVPPGSHSVRAITEATDARGASPPNWRHPRLGSGQIFDLLHDRIRSLGGAVRFSEPVNRVVRNAGGGWQVMTSKAGERCQIVVDHVVSSLPVEALPSMLFQPVGRPLLETSGDTAVPQRHVLLVYLVLRTPPRFPHAWLEVNDRHLRCGRITSYAGFGGDMVPTGKTALCVEFFVGDGDPLLEASDGALTALALAECSRNDLLDPSALTDTWVTRFARTNAAASWREQQSSARQTLLHRIAEIEDFWHVNRPGSDWASFAGLEAGNAIAANRRDIFEKSADPTRRLREAAPKETTNRAGFRHARQRYRC